NAALSSIPAAEQAVLLTVQVEPDEEEAVMALLRDAGGFQVDREHGRWRGGRWTDREPLRRAPSSRRTTGLDRTKWQRCGRETAMLARGPVRAARCLFWLALGACLAACARVPDAQERAVRQAQAGQSADSGWASYRKGRDIVAHADPQRS